MRTYDDKEFEGTGVNTGGGGGADVWLDINAKTAVMTRDKKASVLRDFAGKMVSVDIRFDKGNPDENIKPGWKMTLYMKAKDADGQVKTFGLDVNGSWVIFAPEVINALLGTHTLEWDGYFYLSPYKHKDTKKPRLTVRTVKDQRYVGGLKWIEGDNRYEGCPESPVVGQDANGQPIKNHTEARKFWYNQAKIVYRKVNGTDFVPSGDLATWEQEQGIAAKPAATGATTGAGPTPGEKFWAYFNQKIEADGGDQNKLEKLAKAAISGAPGSGVEVSKVVERLNSQLEKITPDQDIAFNQKGEIELGGRSANAVAASPEPDDLPF